MAKIGFARGNEETRQRQEVKLGNIEKTFLSMLRDISLAEDEALHELDLERKIRRELVKLHKRIKLIEKKREKYDRFIRLSGILFDDSPRRALDALKNAMVLEKEILPEAHALSQEISKHLLPEVAELYHGLDLSNENKKHVRLIARGLTEKLGVIAGPIHSSVQNRVIETQIRNLMMRNPGLK